MYTSSFYKVLLKSMETNWSGFITFKSKFYFSQLRMLHHVIFCVPKDVCFKYDLNVNAKAVAVVFIIKKHN